MSKRINIFLDDREVALLEALQKKYGGNAPQVIRDALKWRFDKAFPIYVTEKKEKITPVPEEEPTPEQVCERAGGKVGVKDGIPVCIIQVNEAYTRNIPMDKLDQLL